MKKQMQTLFSEIERDYPLFFKGDFKYMTDGERVMLHRFVTGPTVSDELKRMMRVNDDADIMGLFQFGREAAHVTEWGALANLINKRKIKEFENDHC